MLSCLFPIIHLGQQKHLIQGRRKVIASTELNITIVLDHFFLHIHTSNPSCQQLEHRNASNRISFLLCFSFPLCQLTDSLYPSFFPSSFSLLLQSIVSVQLQLCSGGGTQPFSRKATCMICGITDACHKWEVLSVVWVWHAQPEKLMSCAAEVLHLGIPSSKNLHGLRCLIDSVSYHFCNNKLKLNDSLSKTKDWY